jgi:CDP-glucose 4,6-dehydratase
MKNEPIILRNPGFIRPWQYILESLFGFLILGTKMLSKKNKYSGAWNFGSSENSLFTCGDVANKALEIWGSKNVQNLKSDFNYQETAYLKIYSKKSKKLLKWMPIYSIDKTLEHTISWYKEYNARISFNSQVDMSDVFENQIRDFMHELRNAPQTTLGG